MRKLSFPLAPLYYSFVTVQKKYFRSTLVVSFISLQYMGIGLHGVPGLTAVKHVVMGRQLDHVRVTTLLQLMVVTIVLVQHLWRKIASNRLVQVS